MDEPNVSSSPVKNQAKESPEMIDDAQEKRSSSEVEVDELSKELQQLNQKIEELAEEKTNRMELLHKYNEVKDATQTIIGKLADANGVTFKSIHEEYDLPMDD